MKKVILVTALLAAFSAHAVEVGVNASIDMANADRSGTGVTIGQKFDRVGVTAGFDRYSKGTDLDKYTVMGSYDVIKVGVATFAAKAGVAYLDALYTAPPYTRMEVMVLKAFPLAPQMQLPVLSGPKNERVYELRSYESATEKIFRNKVKMFNEGDEIGLFKRLNFNAVFYSEVIAGSHMPNLMYMTCFENKADRDAHWKSFSSDPFWKTLSAMPEYQHNVSLNDTRFLRPTGYSDF